MKFAANLNRLPLLLLFVASCAPFGNYLLTGHWEDPNSPTESKSATAASSSAEKVATASPTSSVTAVGEGRIPAASTNTTFSHGQWHLLRTSRATFGWTGTGEQFRLFAFELDSDSDCWYSKQGDRPEAQHCLSGDTPAAAISRSVNGKAVESIFSGFDTVPWKATDSVLPKESPERAHSFGRIDPVEGKSGVVMMSIPWSQGQRVFSLPSDSNVFLVDGIVPDLFDGCARANGTIAVFDGLSVRVGKNKCGIFRGRTNQTTTLSIDQSVFSFTKPATGPDLAQARTKVAQLRSKLGKIQIDVSGDASHTLTTFAGKRDDGAEKSAVEAIATIDGAHYRCESSIDRLDAAWLQSARRICGSMLK